MTTFFVQNEEGFTYMVYFLKLDIKNQKYLFAFHLPMANLHHLAAPTGFRRQILQFLIRLELEKTLSKLFLKVQNRHASKSPKTHKF